VRRNPALLVEMRGNVEMLFHLTGIKDARKVRTIGMAEAISRLRQSGLLPREDARLDLLVELRNGVAHSSEVAATDDLLPTFARTLVVNPDGTTSAWNKDKTKTLHSHGPPARAG
jgi:hypothetical protein